jgi:CubicO group peptidase (beta-lactamase class C family)
MICSNLRVWLVVALSFVCIGSEVGAQSHAELQRLAEELRSKSDYPGVWLASGEVGGSVQIAASGLRKADSPVPVAPLDRLHIGSCTKAMTAVLIARLVERGVLDWSDSFATVAPRYSERLPATHRGVTLEQLLQHRSGYPENARDWLLKRGVFITDFRSEILLDSLGTDQLEPPGAKERYSNLGYLGAGMIAEHRTGRSWEDLMQAEVFRPLGLDSASFGPPSLLDSLEQPWGHAVIEGRLHFAQADNPPALGPAGTVHLNLQDWFHFCELFAGGGPSGFLKAETLAKLVQPELNEEYAYGWVTAKEDWARGRVVTHAGSNRWWFAEATILPERRQVFLCVFNRSGEDASELAAEARRRMWELKAGHK